MKAPHEFSAIPEGLLDPKVYPHHPTSVELVETHISWVFLTGDLVFKVKKPVNLGFLNFGTLDQRRFFCDQEVELNQRLAPNLYLGVVPIVRDGTSLIVDYEGTPIEYAVKMRQLPKARIMTQLLRTGQVTQEQVSHLAATIATFHKDAVSNDEISRGGAMDILKQNIVENVAQTNNAINLGLISRNQFDTIRDYSLDFLDRQAPLFASRKDDGFVRDCHGDLHSGQIFLANDVYITDCIEFNHRFRYIDVASDIAFLAMDLDYFGRPDLSRHLIDKYLHQTDDQQATILLDFYKCYRAYVRGKVTSFRLDSEHLSDGDKRELNFTARQYFNLAYSYTTRDQQPTLFILSGLAGTGKSTISQETMSRTGAAILSSDAVRKELAGIPASEPRHVGFKTDIYSTKIASETFSTAFFSFT